MPSSIGWSFGGNPKGRFETAFPQEMVRFRTYEPEASAPRLLLILCDSQDRSTWIYQIPESDEVNMETPDEELAAYMTSANRHDEPLADGEGRYIDTYGLAGIDMRIYIGHQSLCAFDNKVPIYPAE